MYLLQVLFKGQKFCLMTSHFESCKANAAERKRQLRLVMRRMSKAREDVTVLFGGDTNLRDAEVQYEGGKMLVGKSNSFGGGQLCVCTFGFKNLLPLPSFTDSFHTTYSGHCSPLSILGG